MRCGFLSTPATKTCRWGPRLKENHARDFRPGYTNCENTHRLQAPAQSARRTSDHVPASPQPARNPPHPRLPGRHSPPRHRLLRLASRPCRPRPARGLRDLPAIAEAPSPPPSTTTTSLPSRRPLRTTAGQTRSPARSSSPRTPTPFPNQPSPPPSKFSPPTPSKSSSTTSSPTRPPPRSPTPS